MGDSVKDQGPKGASDVADPSHKGCSTPSFIVQNPDGEEEGAGEDEVEVTTVIQVKKSLETWQVNLQSSLRLRVWRRTRQEQRKRRD